MVDWADLAGFWWCLYGIVRHWISRVCHITNGTYNQFFQDLVRVGSIHTERFKNNQRGYTLRWKAETEDFEFLNQRGESDLIIELKMEN